MQLSLTFKDEWIPVVGSVHMCQAVFKAIDHTGHFTDFTDFTELDIYTQRLGSV